MDSAKIAQLNDKGLLRSLMENAQRLKREDVYRVAFHRLCSLEGMNLGDPLDRDFYVVLNAYEELLTEKNGRTTKASRTRQKLKNKSVKQCLVDWVEGPPTEAFKLLVENGLQELTAEFLVVRYADLFPITLVDAARVRLSNVGG